MAARPPHDGSMQRIGVIGGMSWYSTAEYYRVINERVQERLGGHHSADLLVHSLDFGEIRQCQIDGDWEDVYRAKMSSKKRSEDRRRTRNLAKLGNVEASVARTHEELGAALEDGVVLHTASPARG
jgi:CelD/BcsL family acetyltransferase involved in cellulose biosynthesis